MKTHKTVSRMALAAMLVFVACATRAATTYYVSPRGDDTDGLSWETAKTSIQAAVALATTTGDEVVVTNGTYTAITGTANAAITIRSVNGAEHTFIDGGKTNRCATLGTATTHTETVLTGFTLTNGDAGSEGGGGSIYGTLNACVFTNNTATTGGGAYEGTLNNCTLTSNTAIKNESGTGGAGGGSIYSILNNCLLIKNTAINSGGGVYNGTLINCTLAYNKAGYGGGSNAGTVNNCVLWDNFRLDEITTDNYNGGSINNSCSTFPTLANGNINDDPLFVDAENGDFRLKLNSPCVNAGNNSYAPAGLPDLDGTQRILGGTVDMGAYESIIMPYDEWIDYFGLDDTAASTNRWLAGLDPRDPNAAFLARIELRDGAPHIGWSPDLGKWRAYEILASPTLGKPLTKWDAFAPDTPIPDNMRFFKVKVETP
ncbi:MAG: DUF5123 domain-containing protein [Kiritimatiellaeota bacterium]|nr:DUF5123 domain-containing protein [Kiritimatiellota bacterium]